MKTTYLIFVLALTIAIAKPTSAGEINWRGNAVGTTAQLIESPGLYTEMSGWGGGQIGNFTSLGQHWLGADLSLEGQATWVTQQGDLVFVSYHGRIEITENQTMPYLIAGRIEANGGTGRFVTAKGSAPLKGSMSGNLDQFKMEFEGRLSVPGNTTQSGIVELSSLEAALGQTVPYTMTSLGSKTATHFKTHTGSIRPTCSPTIDDSNPKQTVVSFAATSGTNIRLGRPVHMIQTPDGQLYTEFDAQIRVEIDNQYGLAVQHFDGSYSVLGGTGIYAGASGGFQVQYSTRPSYGDGPVTGKFELAGDIQLANDSKNRKRRPSATDIIQDSATSFATR